MGKIELIFNASCDIEVWYEDNLLGYLRKYDNVYYYVYDSPTIKNLSEDFLLELVEKLQRINKPWKDFLIQSLKYPNKTFTEQFELPFNYEISRNTNNQ